MHNADEIMTAIVAKRLAAHLERAGFAVMKKPADVALQSWEEAFRGKRSRSADDRATNVGGAESYLDSSPETKGPPGAASPKSRRRDQAVIETLRLRSASSSPFSVTMGFSGI